MAAVLSSHNTTQHSRAYVHAPTVAGRAVVCEHYQLGERSLGRHRYGRVMRGCDMRTKALVAIKIFEPTPSAQRAFEAEANSLQRLSWDRHDLSQNAEPWVSMLPHCPSAVHDCPTTFFAHLPEAQFMVSH